MKEWVRECFQNFVEPKEKFVLTETTEETKSSDNPNFSIPLLKKSPN